MLNLPAREPQFTVFQRKCGLVDSEVPHSFMMREWARKHRNTHYVPEALLKFWGIDLDDNLG